MLSKSMMIGTVFEEEEVASKKNFYNIAARDERGKKFFHGSFTGGFSAGYKNTCGSKEGWVPSTFVSSRDQRHKGAKQSIQDYMDDEDLGGNIAGETITARAEYDTLGDTQREYLQKELGSSILGAAPSELIVSAKNSVGYEILRNMGGFKTKPTAQSTVVKKEPKKIYGVHMPSFKTSKPAEEATAFDFDEMTAEYSTQIPKANEQFYGLNYHQANFEEDEYEAVFNKIFKKHANLGQTAEEDEKEKEKAKQKNRMSMKAFGFDEDDEGDRFTGGGGSNKFVVEESDTIDEGLLRKAKMKKANRNALLEFEKDPAPYRVDIKVYKPEEIPKDWDPFKKVKEHFMKGGSLGGEAASQGRKWQDMNPQKRAELLGEDKDILEMKLQSISEEAKKRIAGVKKFVRGEEQTMGGDDLNLIFHGDKDKIERYKFFCWEKLGKLVSGIPPGNMSYEDLRKEKEEFETVYKIQTQPKMSDKVEEEEEEVVQEKPMTEEERKQTELLKRIDELKKNIEKEKGRRKVEYWLPDRILCRRFNVPQPRPRGDVETDQERQQDKFHEEILPAFFGQKPVPKEVKAQPVSMVTEEEMPFKEFKSNKMERAQAFEQQQREAEEVEEEEENVEENEPTENVVEERPPMELFESIFGDEEEA